MAVSNYFKRFNKINDLILQNQTGNAAELAEKIGMSRKMTYIYLDTMKKLGAPISYDIKRKTYFYTKKGTLVLAFVPTKIQKQPI